MPIKLLFVYNANSGRLNAVLDSAHKFLSPSTYPCSLCTLTYNTFGEKKLWKKFREECSVEMDFLHTDELEKKNSNQIYELPVILSEEDLRFTTIMSCKELNETKDLSSLIETLTQKIQTSWST